MPETRCAGYLGRLGGAIPTGQTTLVYQLEYHMKTTVKPRFARPCVAAAAMLAFCLAFGSQAVRAEDSDSPAAPGQDMVLVPAKTVSNLEQRVIYLEESVASLTESWQHINTHRLCVSDDSGAETCISKPQLDALLVQFAQAKISEPAVAQEAAVAPPAAPVQTAAATPPSAEEPTEQVTEWSAKPGKEPITEQTTEWPANPGKEPITEQATEQPTDPGKEPITGPAAVVGDSLPSDQDKDITGTVKLADQDSSAGLSTGPAVVSYPKVEVYEEPAARTND
jgi:hypothetical protein